MSMTETFGPIFGFDYIHNRFTYDCKLYEQDGKWLWKDGSYCRDVDEAELREIAKIGENITPYYKPEKCSLCKLIWGFGAKKYCTELFNNGKSKLCSKNGVRKDCPLTENPNKNN